MDTLRCRHLVPCAAMLLPLLLHAEPINDPTRPPAPPAVAASGVARAGNAASAPAPQPPRLVSVQVPQHGGAPSAIVDNKLIFVGDKLGGRTVVAIDLQGLQLRDAKGRTDRMPLLDAGVVKQAAASTGASPIPVAAMAGGKP